MMKMTAIELMKNLKYPFAEKLELMGYEKTFLLQRAAELNMSDEEVQNLKEIIKKDSYSFIDKKKMLANLNKVVYNLVTLEKTTVLELARKYKYPSKVIRRRIENQICIKNTPYGYSRDDSYLFYKIPSRPTYYYNCDGVPQLTLDAKGWREYFQDDTLVVSKYADGQNGYKKKYRDKYRFKKTDLFIDYIRNNKVE